MLHSLITKISVDRETGIGVHFRQVSIANLNYFAHEEKSLMWLFCNLMKYHCQIIFFLISKQSSSHESHQKKVFQDIAFIIFFIVTCLNSNVLIILGETESWRM